MFASGVLRGVAKRTREQFQIALKYGPSGNLDELINFKRVWSLEGNATSLSRDQSSLSDIASYLEICSLAQEQNDIYRKFKSCREYRQILEHVSREQGREYLDILKKDTWMSEFLATLVKGDVGSPYRYTYRDFGRVSPTNLRYAKIAGDLYALFGSLDGFNVAEIGVGYGGQCVALGKLFDIARYELFDLEPVLGLADRYIKDANVNILIGKNSSPIKLSTPCDLLISNYAFSELIHAVQQDFFINVIRDAKRGYVIYNHINPAEFQSLSATEFASMIPGAEIFMEIPLTHPKNVLVVWGHDQVLDTSRFVRI